MQPAKRIIANILESPQYQESVEIMTLLSKYRADHGHELDDSTLKHQCHISQSTCDGILAGQQNIPVKYYDRYIRAINQIASNNY